MWIDWAEDVLRGAGLDVLGVGKAPGLAGHEWKRRARGSGQYHYGVQGQVLHHTVSNPRSDGWGDVNYITFGASARPISNGYFSRSGKIWLCAAGGTNTEGKGGPYYSIPQDGANARVWSWEIANNGIGEAYPRAQQDAVLEANAVMWLWLGKVNGWDKEGPAGWWRQFMHYIWAPTRKVDPRGPSRWSHNRNEKWDNGLFVGDMITRVAQLLNTPPPPPEPPKPPTTPPPVIVPPDIKRVSDGLYYVQPGDGPYRASQRIYGNGEWMAAITPPEPATPGFNAHGHQIKAPGVGGFLTNVKANEGPYSIIRRVFPNGNPADRLARFYDFNGGPNRVLSIGDLVFVSDW